MKIAHDTLLFFPTLAPLGGDELRLGARQLRWRCEPA
jgi:hypothetical protein